MDKDSAIQFLCDACIFDQPVSTAGAEALWDSYRSKVEAIPERDALAPKRLPITDFHESEAVNKFRQRFRGATNVLDAIRIDPMQLVVHQLYVIMDRSGSYGNKVDSRLKWIKNAVLCDGLAPDLRFRTGRSAIDVEVPHAEYIFVCDPRTLKLAFPQLARHVSVTAFDNRMVLTAGYHRTYARMESMPPDARDRSIVVPLTTDGDFLVSPASPNQGVREMLMGRRPPLFADFFDERLFIKVKLRKKRFELQIRGQIVAIDEP
jgi:hypothetical protein